jgi:Excalibur calcium-binding domain
MAVTRSRPWNDRIDFGVSSANSGYADAQLLFVSGGGTMKRRRAEWVLVAVAAVGFALIAAVPVAPTASADPPYRNCKEAIADGAAPVFKGDPGYSEELDTNGDGMACLSGSGATYFPP